jgi:RecJ-like exonuclease
MCLYHHMPYDGFPREFAGSYINVCDFGGIASFTAGLLACIFAQVLSRVDVDDVLQAALVSDYSIYANFKDDEALKNSIILDYLTSSANELFHRPRQLDLILRDKEKSESTFRHASNLLKEAIDTGIKNVKNYKNADGLNIYILDFGHIARLRLDYPLPGRYSSKLQERLEHMSGGKTITLVHYGSYVSIRTSSDIHESINILDIIEKLKAQTGGMVSGGGHRQAASIRTDREHLREVIRLILLEFGVQAQED